MVTESINPRAIDKIKKCLALSQSDNPHEAAAALRQAKAMMEKYGVSDAAITRSDIGESTTKTKSRRSIPRWEVALITMVGSAFGCKTMYQAWQGQYTFVGIKDKAELAAYTATVLLRRANTARKNYLDQITSQYRLTRGEKTKMADAFCLGWVHTINKTVSAFANPPEVEEVIAQHVADETQGRATKTRDTIGKKLDGIAAFAARAGAAAASGESIHRPMGEASKAPALAHVQ